MSFALTFSSISLLVPIVLLNKCYLYVGRYCTSSASPSVVEDLIFCYKYV